MQKYTSCLCCLVGCLIALAGCGVATLGAAPSSNSTSTVTASAIPTSTPGDANTTPGTSTSGPIIITTDHMTYAARDSIQVTLTNGLATAIGAYNHQASCSIFALETLINGTWQSVAKMNSSLATCSQGQATTLITVNAGSAYHATIQADASVKSSGGFPQGQYRIHLTYTTTPSANLANQPVATEGNPAFTSLYSTTLTVA